MITGNLNVLSSHTLHAISVSELSSLEPSSLEVSISKLYLGSSIQSGFYFVKSFVN